MEIILGIFCLGNRKKTLFIIFIINFQRLKIINPAVGERVNRAQGDKVLNTDSKWLGDPSHIFPKIQENDFLSWVTKKEPKWQRWCLGLCGRDLGTERAAEMLPLFVAPGQRWWVEPAEWEGQVGTWTSALPGGGGRGEGCWEQLPHRTRWDICLCFQSWS